MYWRVFYMRYVILFLFFFSSALFAKNYLNPIREDFDDLGLHDDALVYLPKDYSKGKTYPLIISLHGLGANAYVQNITFNFKELVTKRQFILVVPEGMVGMGGLRYWNATDFCCGSRQSTKTDDVKYISSIIEKMISRYQVDANSVHLFGHSNGGFLANRMACDVPELFKSMASVAGTTFWDDKKCKSKSPVSMLHIHGTVDNIVLYNGIEDTYPGAKETTKRWVERNKCRGEVQRAQNEIFYYTPYNKFFVTKEENWKSCEDKSAVSLWTVENVSHMMRFNREYLERILDFFLGQL